MRRESRTPVSYTHLFNADHRVLFEDTTILSSESAYYFRLHLESVEIFERSSVAMNRRVFLLNKIGHAVLPSQSDSTLCWIIDVPLQVGSYWYKILYKRAFSGKTHSLRGELAVTVPMVSTVGAKTVVNNDNSTPRPSRTIHSNDFNTVDSGRESSRTCISYLFLLKNLQVTNILLVIKNINTRATNVDSIHVTHTYIHMCVFNISKFLYICMFLCISIFFRKVYFLILK